VLGLVLAANLEEGWKRQFPRDLGFYLFATIFHLFGNWKVNSVQWNQKQSFFPLPLSLPLSYSTQIKGLSLCTLIMFVDVFSSEKFSCFISVQTVKTKKKYFSNCF
jgi:hypothetical protein